MRLAIFTRLTTIVFLVSCLVVATTAKGGDGDPLLYGIHLDTGALYSFSADMPPPGSFVSVTEIGDTGVPGLGSLEFAPNGILYGYTTGVDATLYSIDPGTAAATEVGPLNLGYYVYEGGLAIAPDGTAYGANGINQTSPLLYSVDLDTGQAAPIGLIPGGQHDIGGLAWRDGELIGLDRILPSSLLTLDPNDANVLGGMALDVNIDVGINGGLAILNPSSPRGRALGYFTTAGLSGDGPGDNSLYGFDPYSGLHGWIGQFDPTVITGAGFGGLAIVPEPASFVLLALGGLTLLRRRRS